MGDQLTPINKHSPEQGTSVNKDTKQSSQLTYQKQLPNCVPTHDCDEVPWYEAGSVKSTQECIGCRQFKFFA